MGAHFEKTTTRNVSKSLRPFLEKDKGSGITGSLLNDFHCYRLVAGWFFPTPIAQQNVEPSFVKR